MATDYQVYQPHSKGDVMGPIYLIQKLWIDALCSTRDESFGYEALGYVGDEAKAKEICEGCPVFTKKHNLCFREDMPEYRYVKVEPFTGVRVKYDDSMFYREMIVGHEH